MINRLHPQNYTTIISLVLLFVGCASANLTNRELAMVVIEQTGVNSTELEQVISHYQSIDPDSEKLEAAYYLIGNMESKIAIEAADSAHYNSQLRTLGKLHDPRGWNPYVSTTSKWLDSLSSTHSIRAVVRDDCSTITTDYLIRSIDAAFERWRGSAWSHDYAFEEFCEWVLPYRTDRERLELWRRLALEIVRDNEDSLRRDGTLFELGEHLMGNTRIYYNIGMAKFPIPMAFSDMNAARRGSCEHMADYALKMFRSRAIPSALDVIPTWANRRGAHVWNAIVLPNGKCQDIGYNPNGKNVMVYKVPKIYRQRFSPMRDDILYPLRETGALPDFFAACDKQDVTAQYDMPLADLSIQGLELSQAEVAWLCTFNNSEWIPVAYAQIRRGGALFKDMALGLLPGDNKPIAYQNDGDGIVYLPAYYNFGEVIPAGLPRILHQDGRAHILEIDTINRQTITVGRKYPKHPEFDLCEKRMIGGRFEGANRSDFKGAVTLLTVDRQQAYPMERHAIATEIAHAAYRYVRYVSPGRASIAEVRFYSAGAAILGRPIGTVGQEAEQGPAALFDGDMESYFQSAEKDSIGSWAGLDLGRPMQVTEIAFAARTDDNDIRLGDTYQLSYWNNGWVNTPTVVADSNFVSWSEIPSNTLYLLRNLSRGVEHRPFTYENGVQIWW